MTIQTSAETLETGDRDADGQPSSAQLEERARSVSCRDAQETNGCGVCVVVSCRIVAFRLIPFGVAHLVNRAVTLSDCLTVCLSVCLV